MTRTSPGRCGASSQSIASQPLDRWDGAENGDLLDIAQSEFDVLLSTDKGIKYQQNVAGRTIAVITLRAIDNRIETLAPLMPQVLALLPAVQPGRVYFVPPKEATEPGE